MMKKGASNMGFSDDSSFQYIPYGMSDSNVEDLSMNAPASPTASKNPMEISILSHLMAGKKRIVASKSKLKHRPTINTGHPVLLNVSKNLGPMYQEGLLWTDDEFTVTELVDNFAYEFPLLVKVTSPGLEIPSDPNRWQILGQVRRCKIWL